MKAGRAAVVAASLLGALTLCGCRDYWPHSFTWFGGRIAQTHAKPAGRGYYADWDPFAATLEVAPVPQAAQVDSQRVLVATVKDAQGRPLPNRRVEWMIAEGSVGTIVEADESGWWPSRGYKVTSKYAVTHTNNGSHVLTRGNRDPSDDVRLTRGQSWCVITSPAEGTTHVVVYAPGIHDWAKHKVSVRSRWYDVGWKLPADTSSRVGEPQVLSTRVTRLSDPGAPGLAGYVVRYTIREGPAGRFVPGGGAVASVQADENGVAAVRLDQTPPKTGTNVIQVEIVRPGSGAPPGQGGEVIHVSEVRKAWVAPQVAMAMKAPPNALLGETFHYEITVSNPGKLSADQVVVTDEIPDGIVPLSTTPEAKVVDHKLVWSLGSLAAGGSQTLGVMVRCVKTGRQTNVVRVTAADGLSAQASADTQIARPGLTLTKDAPAEANLCDPIPPTPSQ